MVVLLLVVVVNGGRLMVVVVMILFGAADIAAYYRFVLFVMRQVGFLLFSRLMVAQDSSVGGGVGERSKRVQ